MSPDNWELRRTALVTSFAYSARCAFLSAIDLSIDAFTDLNIAGSLDAAVSLESSSAETGTGL